MNMRRNARGDLTVAPWPPGSDARWGKLRDGLRIAVPFVVRFAPHELSAGPAIEIEVDEHSGALVVTRVVLSASADHPIASDALRAYSVSKLAAVGARSVAAPPSGWKSSDSPSVPSAAAIVESVTAATRARVNVDRERLAEVGEWFDRGGVEAVQSGLNVSRSQAYRLIKAAREQGDIEED